jgi:hypothetical protein
MDCPVCVGSDALERPVTGYYSALSDNDARDQELWGDFALDEFPREERELNR